MRTHVHAFVLGTFLIILATLVIVSRAEALDRIRIAVSNPNMPNLTVAVAQKNGFLKDENLDAEIIRMNPNVAITALASGDVDYCQLFGAVVGGAIAGLPVRIVAGFLDNWPMTLIAQPEYKSLKDLQRKDTRGKQLRRDAGRWRPHDDKAGRS
jgi:ABC-type nitrate/sulfonate/bicarbonate transport system substrate-binding protein